MNLSAISQQRRAMAARKFLKNAEAGLNRRGPVPEEDAVELKDYGTIRRGRSAIRVVLLGHRTEPSWYQLLLERNGPSPEDVVTDPESARQLADALAAVGRDFDDFGKLIERPEATPATGGPAPLTEREAEVLRIFGVERGPRGFLISVRPPAEAKGRGGR